MYKLNQKAYQYYINKMQGIIIRTKSVRDTVPYAGKWQLTSLLNNQINNIGLPTPNNRGFYKVFIPIVFNGIRGKYVIKCTIDHNR